MQVLLGLERMCRDGKSRHRDFLEHTQRHSKLSGEFNVDIFADAGP